MSINRNQIIVLVLFAFFAHGVMRRNTPVDSRDLGGCAIFVALLYVARDKKPKLDL